MLPDITKTKNISYLSRKWNRKRYNDHMRVGILYSIFHPWLLTAWLPIVFAIVLIWSNMNFLCKPIEIPEPFNQVYSCIILLIVGMILPILLILSPVEIIGNLVSSKDEAEIQMALPKEALRYGSPILRYKKTDKKSGKTVRVFDSPVTLDIWIKSKENICDHMNIRILVLEYNPKMIGLQIRMTSVNNRLPPDRGDLTDEQF